MLGATRHGSVIHGDARARRGPGDRCSGARGQCRPTVRPTARPHPSCLSPSSAGPRVQAGKDMPFLHIGGSVYSF